MKYLNRIEIIKFTKKYFPNYLEDIRSVSYFDYNNKREYLINNHYIFVVDMKSTKWFALFLFIKNGKITILIKGA